MNFVNRKVGYGTRLQAGIPKTIQRNDPKRANGLLVRGIVIATYVTDDENHPRIDDQPTAIYCDVLIMPSLPGYRWHCLKQVLVTQEKRGLHHGTIWKPKAISKDLLDKIDLNGGANPANLDGDHVLVGFLNDMLNQPVILRSLPHPSQDIGNEQYPVGKRIKLKVADGDPDFTKHHGSFYGIDDSGNFVLDTTFANDGLVETDGKETSPPSDGKGSHTYKLQQDATYAIVLYDMTDPLTPVEVWKTEYTKLGHTLTIQDASGEFKIDINNDSTISIKGTGSSASLTLGDGSVSAANADRLETLYNSLKTKLDTFDTHVHTAPSGGGPTTTPTPTITAPSWDSNINSSKVTFPDG